jgi:hypothetical protein
VLLGLACCHSGQLGRGRHSRVNRPLVCGCGPCVWKVKHQQSVLLLCVCAVCVCPDIDGAGIVCEWCWHSAQSVGNTFGNVCGCGGCGPQMHAA